MVGYYFLGLLFANWAFSLPRRPNICALYGVVAAVLLYRGVIGGDRDGDATPGRPASEQPKLADSQNRAADSVARVLHHSHWSECRDDVGRGLRRGNTDDTRYRGDGSVDDRGARDAAGTDAERGAPGRGIHPGAHVGVQLIIFLAMIYVLFYACMLWRSVQNSIVRCNEWERDPKNPDWVIENYSDVDRHSGFFYTRSFYCPESHRDLVNSKLFQSAAQALIAFCAMLW
ncbi:hypothetical protein Daesc_000317 [Daldinia eschscholtzii]|uniref:Uncharacterized protein n=1 Tax=Daldinia eschscholtzii TaxID=292717 RepID=A0AAX6MXZ3_9PEZI